MFVRISSDTALIEELRSAVVPPPLCKTCRWCRPAWGNLVMPLWWPFPLFWRWFWKGATCRHPTSVHRPSKDYVTGHQEKPRRMFCDVARGYDREHCGPHARFWEARRYPAWFWMIGSVGAGLIITITYIAFLRWV